MKFKLIIISTAIYCLMGCSEGNKINVPDAIKAKFSQMYPHASNVKWEKEDDNFEAIFRLDKNETSVLLTKEGTLVETETEIDEKLLPANILEYVKTQLGGKKISSATVISKPSGESSFEIEVDHQDYLFDSTGQFKGKEVEEQGEKD